MLAREGLRLTTTSGYAPARWSSAHELRRSRGPMVVGCRRMHVARHTVDAQLAEKLIAVNAEVLERNLQRVAAGEIIELSATRSIAVATAANRCVTGGSPAEIIELLTAASRLGGALWALANGDAEIVLDLPSQACRISGRIHEGYINSPQWLDCFWLATIADDRNSVRALCSSTRDLRASSTRTDEHNHLLAEAMRKHASGDPDAHSVAPRALALAACGPHSLSADWVRSIDRPTIDVAVHVLARDAVGADRAFLQAFEAHRAYWGAPSRAKNERGWISIELAALMVMARRAGLQLTTTSDYAPAQLINRA